MPRGQRERERVQQKKERKRHHQEETAIEPDSLPKGLPELRTPDHPLGVAQPRAGRRRHSGSGPDPLAPLLTPSLEDQPAPLGAHPHQEAVRPLPLAVVRLEGPFHGWSSRAHGTQAPDGPRLPWAKAQVYSPLVFPVNRASSGGP